MLRSNITLDAPVYQTTPVTLTPVTLTPVPFPQRRGISLLEVLISVGVIALGIFGVAALIPVAQFKVEQGLTAERTATMGQRAVAEFRIRNMGAPGTVARPNWVTAVGTTKSPIDGSDLIGPPSLPGGDTVIASGFCIDPLGIAFGVSSGVQATGLGQFPTADVVGGDATYLRMPRLSLNERDMFSAAVGNRPLSLATANEIFLLPDDLVFDRPDEMGSQPRRQYFTYSQFPLKAFSEGTMSWFATLTPDVALRLRPNDWWDAPGEAPDVDQSYMPLVKHPRDFLLSIVVVKNRPVAVPSALDEAVAVVTPRFAGEILLNDSARGDPINDDNLRVSDLRIGDWLLLTKMSERGSYRKIHYRWTKIIGADDREGALGTVDDATTRTFTIANDDFFGGTPADTGGRGGQLSAHAVFVRGVVAVFERSIRLENSSSWNPSGLLTSQTNL